MEYSAVPATHPAQRDPFTTRKRLLYQEEQVVSAPQSRTSGSPATGASEPSRRPGRPCAASASRLRPSWLRPRHAPVRTALMPV